MDAVSLGGIVLADATTGVSIDLGAGPAKALLSIIRHRH